MKLAYEAYEKSGRHVSDVIEAAGQTEAGEILRRQGLFVSHIRPAEGAWHRKLSRPGRRVGRTARLRDLSTFCRQLHVLIGSGTPMVQALEAIERQSREGPWRDVIADVRRRVEEGVPLSEAMAAHPKWFDPVSRTMMSAGESGSMMNEMLHRLETLVHRQLHVRRAVLGSMTYPAILVCLSVGVLAVLLTYVVPRFGELFQTLEVPLPPTTQMLLTASEAVRGYWWVLVAVVAGGVVACRFYLSTASGKAMLDTAILRFPKISLVAKNIITARIVRMLGSMLESRVPVLEALQLARHSAGNTHYVKLISQAEQLVTRGEPMSLAFDKPELISPSVCEAIRSGERSGQVGRLLLTIGDFLDEENETMLRSLTSIIEPLILILMGGVVGLVATSLFIPLFDLTASVSGGP